MAALLTKDGRSTVYIFIHKVVTVGSSRGSRSLSEMISRPKCLQEDKNQATHVSKHKTD